VKAPTSFQADERTRAWRRMRRVPRAVAATQRRSDGEVQATMRSREKKRATTLKKP
jgi:hypothetical protein